MDILEKLGELGIIPVIKIENEEAAADLAEALVKGGLPCVEITFRTKTAAKSINRITASHPQVLVGAGTILSIDQAEQAVEAGARFLVSPGFNPRLVDWCLEQGVPVIPGFATPSEAMQALERGLAVLKFFPAEAMGGIPFIEAISPALPGARYVPTGGINARNMAAWLNLPSVHAVAGTWLATLKLLEEHAFDEITRLAKEAVQIAGSVRPGKEAE